ncbi:MAG: DUF1800 domain-containing protein [Fimbriimonas sp.]
MLQNLEKACEVAADAAENLGETSNRRALFATGITAGLLALAGRSEAQSGGGIDPTTSWSSANARAARKMTYGVTETDLAELDKMGFMGWRERMLGRYIDDSALETVITSRYPRTRMTAPQLGKLTDDWVTIQQLGEATIMRSAFSKNQLYERMVEFWTDHFNVHVDKVGGWVMAPFVRQAIRENALGGFSAMLRAVCQSAAMLAYLDNTENFFDNGNVNFARELMELHTMGSDGGYTQSDVRQVARCFSGWSFLWDPGGPNHGNFWFYDWGHSNLTKTVLGVTIPAGGGRSDGDRVISILLAHPSTAKFIARKLCRFLLQYDPPQAVINRAAAEFTRTGGFIRAVVSVILTPENINASKPKYKRPYHLFIGALRQMKAQMPGDQWAIRYEHLYQAGQLPYSWNMPDGYPDKLAFWATLILPRWNYALMLTQNYVWNVTVDIPALLGPAKTPETITAKINSLLFANEMHPADRDALLVFLKAAPLDPKRIQAAFSLALASPSNQWY